MTTIVYVHGFNSSSTSETATMVLNACNDAGYRVIGFDYSNDDLLDPEGISERLHTLSIGLESIDEEVIFVGSSLGGFFANHMACITGNKALLINPAIRAYESMKKYNVADCVIDGLWNMSRYDHLFDNPQRIVICGNQDDVVSPMINGRTLLAEIINVDMGHRLEPKYLDLVMESIIRLDNNLIQ